MEVPRRAYLTWYMVLRICGTPLLDILSNMANEDKGKPPCYGHLICPVSFWLLHCLWDLVH